MIQDREYLKDVSFLMNLTRERNKEVYVKITSLDFKTEEELEEVEGLVINGSISVDGSSAVRRTGNLSIFCNIDSTPQYNEVYYYRNFFSISKKIDVKIGLSNTINQKYPQIIWFKMGRYIITNSSFSNNINGGITININIGDKMNLLNGFCGGTITASTELDKVEDIDKEGKKVTRRATIYEMIMELVNHLGGEQLGKILISDLESTTKTGVRIKDSSEKKYYINYSDDLSAEIKEFEADVSPVDIETYQAGDFIGYKYVDYTYPTKDYFTLNSGETVVTGLDKIKSNIGNYEYFYDIDGNFRWQEIKDYRNTSKATMDLKNLSNRDYLVDIDNGNALYNFENSDIIISYNNTPQYSNLKNDFIIWGTRTIGEGSEKKTFPIRYHLAIDDKPVFSYEFNEDNLYLIMEDENSSTGEKEYKAPIFYENVSQLPSIGNESLVYFVQENQQLYKYDPTGEQYIKIFSKDVKNPNENISNFYEEYDKLYKEAKENQQEKQNVFFQIQEEYSKILENLNNIIVDVENIQNLFNKDITYSSFILNKTGLLDESNKYSQYNSDLNKIINNCLNDDLVNEKNEKVIYNKEKWLPEITKILNKTNFSSDTEKIVKNLNDFSEFYNNYKNQYENNIFDYKIALLKYYDLFISYEKAASKEEKTEIKDSADKLLVNTKFDIKEYLNNLNKISNIADPNINKYQSELNKKISIFKRVIQIAGIAEGEFSLNEKYRIESTSSSSALLYKYINDDLQLLYENNAINIFMTLFKKELDILLEDYKYLQESFNNSSLDTELNSTEESFLKSIFLTVLSPLSTLGSTLSDDISSLFIYTNKSNFPSEINEEKNTGLLDGDTGEIYIPSKKAGYYPATGIVSIKYIFPQNWRTVLLLQNLDTYNSENNVYSEELNKEWEKIFDLVPYKNEKGENIYKDSYIIYTDKFKETIYSKSDSLDYWLDFIDSKAMDFNELKISNIGRRTLVQKNDKVNCIFAPQIPDYIIIDNDISQSELEEKGEKYIKVDETFYNENCETNGLTLYSAFESISNTLYNYLGYNNTINISCLPMFFLEPNTRIKLRDEASNIYGDYIIKSFSISLNNLSTMNIVCTKIIDSI